MRFLVLASALSFAALALTGCGMTSRDAFSGSQQLTGPALQGKLFGGQQPVAGSTIQLYAVGTSGYGTGASALISSTVLTDASGNFNISGTYTCPAGAQVYINASGGNAGAGNNSAIALMAGLGPYSALTASTYITINEITTVGAVWSLSPFMTGTATSANIGAPASNTAGLEQGFADISQIVNNANGTTPGPALPAGALAPTTEINTLSNIIASCINSSGPSSSACSRLFANATAGSSVPANTIAAAVNIARNPANNVNNLLDLSVPEAPFQPVLTAATDFTVGVTYPVGTAPAAVAVDATGNIWVANNASSTVTRLTHAGGPTTYTAATGALSQPTSIAIDTAGNAWVTNTSNSLTEITASGSGSNFVGGGLNAPRSVAIDGLGMIWVANGGENTASAFSSAGVAISPTAGYPTATSGATGSVAIAVDPH